MPGRMRRAITYGTYVAAAFLFAGEVLSGQSCTKDFIKSTHLNEGDIALYFCFLRRIILAPIASKWRR